MSRKLSACGATLLDMSDWQQAWDHFHSYVPDEFDRGPDDEGLFDFSDLADLGPLWYGLADCGCRCAWASIHPAHFPISMYATSILKPCEWIRAKKMIGHMEHSIHNGGFLGPTLFGPCERERPVVFIAEMERWRMRPSFKGHPPWWPR